MPGQKQPCLEDTYMEHIKLNMTDFLDLFMVIGRIQNEIWSTLPPHENKTIALLNVHQIQALINLFLREKFKKEPVTLNQLGDQLSMKKAAASLMVSDLSKKKLVVRTVDESNRRHIRIHLTPAGRRLGEAINKRGAELIEQLFVRAGEESDLTDDAVEGFQMTAKFLCLAYRAHMDESE